MGKKDWRKTHWMSRDKFYMRFYRIKERCDNPNNKSYKNYWARWIKCDWSNFEEFYNDMYPDYKKWLTIDRIDNNWNYNKENCRWITNQEQQNNKRNNHTITYKGETYSLAEWSRKLHINYNTLASRLYRWLSIEEAFNL